LVKESGLDMDIKSISCNYSKTLAYFLLLVIDIWVIDTSLGFINSPSDIGVVIGICLLITSITIIFVIGYNITVKLINYINKLG